MITSARNDIFPRDHKLPKDIPPLSFIRNSHKITYGRNFIKTPLPAPFICVNSKIDNNLGLLLCSEVAVDPHYLLFQGKCLTQI